MYVVKESLLYVKLQKFELDLVADHGLRFLKTDICGNPYYSYNFFNSLNSKEEHDLVAELENAIQEAGSFRDWRKDDRKVYVLMQIYCTSLGYYEPLRKGFDIMEWALETALYHWVHLYLWFDDFREVAIAVGEMDHCSFFVDDIIKVLERRKKCCLNEEHVERILELMGELGVIDNIGGIYQEAGKIFSKNIEPKARDYLKFVLGSIHKKEFFDKYEHSVICLKPPQEIQIKLDDMRDKDVSECLPDRESDLAKAFSPFWYLIDEVENEDVS